MMCQQRASHQPRPLINSPRINPRPPRPPHPLQRLIHLSCPVNLHTRTHALVSRQAGACLPSGTGSAVPLFYLYISCTDCSTSGAWCTSWAQKGAVGAIYTHTHTCIHTGTLTHACIHTGTLTHACIHTGYRQHTRAPLHSHGMYHSARRRGHVSSECRPGRRRSTRSLGGSSRRSSRRRRGTCAAQL